MNNKNNNDCLQVTFSYIIVIIAVVTGYNTLQEEASPSQQLSYFWWLKKMKMVGKIYHLSARHLSIIEVKGSYKGAEKG